MQDWKSVGFSEFFSNQIQGEAASFEPARVTNVERGHYSVLAESGAHSAKLSGRFEFVAIDASDFPAVGDWVLLRAGSEDPLRIIERVLERRSKLIRKRAGEQVSAQVIAANVDYVLIVQSCQADFNLRRLERYLVAVADSDALPVIILSKSDLDPGGLINYRGERVHRLSAINDADLGAIDPYVQAGVTTVVVGSSGVGKSTLINRLCGGTPQPTQAARQADGKGRHTTTSRQMLKTASGGLIIDTPGMREFGLLDTDAVSSGLFDDIKELSALCRYSNCSHLTEPDCAVLDAVASGSLDPARMRSLEKLKNEEAYHARKSDAQASANAKRKWKATTKLMRSRPSSSSKTRK